MDNETTLQLSASTKRIETRRIISAGAFVSGMVLLWALLHHYRALARDGELYAVQAFARLHPQLMSDVFLANASQDQFTLFSPVYALFIRLFGLLQASETLFIVTTIWFLMAAFALLRQLSSTLIAGLSVIMLISVAGSYGAFGIFTYAEPYLTARTVAEALVVTSLFAYQQRSVVWTFALIAIAFLIHPLMTLPGAILLLCLHLPLRASAILLVVGTAGVALLAVLVVNFSLFSDTLVVMNGEWLTVVRERSQFLFLQYWGRVDWGLHARAFICLAVTAASVKELQLRRLAIVAAMVGAAGLTIAFVAGTIGPVALLLQGQAWRWFWLTNFMSLLLLAPTLLHLWRERCLGRFCCALLLVAWTFPPIEGYQAAALALALWCARRRLSERMSVLFRWGSYGLGAVVLAWAAQNSYVVLHAPALEGSLRAIFFDRVKGIFAAQILAVLAFAAYWYWIRIDTVLWRVATGAVLMTLCAAITLPTSLRQVQSTGSEREYKAFAVWRDAIPPQSNVLVIANRVAASFSWFTLRRPSYLSVNQSSGVIFSPITAAEIRRRANVLLPIMEPDWQIFSHLERQSVGNGISSAEVIKLSAESLQAICADPVLGFVIAPEALPFERIRYPYAGAYRDWNLYDCRHVRTLVPSA